jgi:hypothetical protein
MLACQPQQQLDSKADLHPQRDPSMQARHSKYCKRAGDHVERLIDLDRALYSVGAQVTAPCGPDPGHICLPTGTAGQGRAAAVTFCQAGGSEPLPLVVPGGAGGQSPFTSSLLPNSLGLVTLIPEPDMVADVQSSTAQKDRRWQSFRRNQATLEGVPV